MKSINKIDFIKNAKTIIYSFLAFLLIGVVILCVFGLNLGADFVGSTDIKVVIGEEISSTSPISNYNEYAQDIQQIIKANGGKILSTQKLGDGTDSAIIVKIQNWKTQALTATNSQTIVDDLVSELNVGEVNYDIEYAINQGGNMGSQTFVNALYTTLICIIVVMIYLAIRYKLLNSLSVVISMLSTIGYSVIMFAMCRIPLNITVYIGIIISCMFSLMLTLNAIIKLSDDDKMRSDKASATNVNKYMKKCVVTTGLIVICLAVVILACIIAGLTSVVYFALLLMVSIISGGLSSLFGLYYWNYFNTYTEQKVIKKVEIE